MYGQLKLEIRKNVLTRRVVNSRSQFSREDVEHASLEIFRTWLAKAMGRASFEQDLGFKDSYYVNDSVFLCQRRQA